MTVTRALELINVDQVPSTYTSFMTCHSWTFEHQGVGYRLVEWQGSKLFVETTKLPRTTLDEISLKGSN